MRAVVAGVCMSVALACVGTPDARELRTRRTEVSRVPRSDGLTRLAIYNFNIHALENDWTAWIDHVRDSQHLISPVIVLLQDIPAGKIDELLDRFEDRKNGFNGKWAARTFVSRRGERALARTVAWDRTALKLMRVRTFRGFGGSALAPRCSRDDNAGAVQVVLMHRSSRRTVSATSIKSPHKKDFDACARRNAGLLDAKLAEQGWVGDLTVVGTDANAPDRYRGSWTCWYRRANAALGPRCGGTAVGGFEDPIYTVCRRSGTDHQNALRCLRSAHTNRAQPPIGGRIDFILSRVESGELQVAAAETLPLGAPGCDNHSPGRSRDCYSDHRSVYVLIELP